ncbi:MAG: hypothetical protein K2M79_05665 [Muribaculaceae bacterium]|nr:hypothetical protein [Muribaculaceae bacterium]
MDQIIAIAVVVGVFLYKLFSKSKAAGHSSRAVELPSTRHAVNNFTGSPVISSRPDSISHPQIPPVPVSAPKNTAGNSTAVHADTPETAVNTSLQDLRRAFIVGELLRPKFRD